MGGFVVGKPSRGFRTTHGNYHVDPRKRRKGCDKAAADIPCGYSILLTTAATGQKQPLSEPTKFSGRGGAGHLPQLNFEMHRSQYTYPSRTEE